jgi:hypothetical protein
MESVGSLRSVTDGVTDWLAALVEAMPDLAPRRTDPAQEDPAIAAGWLRRFVHDVVTTNPVTRDSLTNSRSSCLNRPWIAWIGRR